MAKMQRQSSKNPAGRQQDLNDADQAQSVPCCPIHGTANIPFGFPMQPAPFACPVHSNPFTIGFQMGKAYQCLLNNQQHFAKPEAMNEDNHQNPTTIKSYHSQRIRKNAPFGRGQVSDEKKQRVFNSKPLDEAQQERKRSKASTDSVYGRYILRPKNFSRHTNLDIKVENMSIEDMQLATMIVNRRGKDVTARIPQKNKRIQDISSDSIIGGRVRQTKKKNARKDSAAMDKEAENMAFNDMRMATAVVNKSKENVFASAQKKVQEISSDSVIGGSKIQAKVHYEPMDRSEMDMDAQNRAFFDMQLATLIVNKGNDPFNSVKGRKSKTQKSESDNSIIGGRLLEKRQGACEEGPLDLEMGDWAANDMRLATMIVNDVDQVFAMAISEHRKR